MKQISAILLAIDGDYADQFLLAEVESIASRGRSQVTILNIVEPARGDAEKNVAVSSLQERGPKTRVAQIEQLSAALSEKGLPVDVHHVIGKPYLEIIRQTLKSQYDLVVKPARRESGIAQRLLGGTDIQLLSLCPIPVWIFRPTVSMSLKKIAVAVDLQPDEPERSELADKILGWGKFVAESAGAELHVVHAWDLYPEESLRTGKDHLHRRWLYDALEKAGLGNDEVHVHLIKGEATHLIPRIADELEIDVLVMGTVGRTGIPGFFIGNTADTVLRKVSCSVFAVKPKGFATPVKLAPRT